MKTHNQSISLCINHFAVNINTKTSFRLPGSLHA